VGFSFTTRTTLADLAGPRVRTATDTSLKRMAREGAEQMRRDVVEMTPKRTGELAESWFTTEVRIGQTIGALTYESSVRSHSFIALFIEKGVEPHLLRPRHVRHALAFVDPHTGEQVEVRGVDHPGFQGRHYIATAGALAEAEFRARMAPLAREWARDALRAMRRPT
jgi:hypothetical protein